MPDHARQLTPAECRSHLYQHLSGVVAYWRDLPEQQLLAGNPGGDVGHERLTGLLFSILSTIDGSALAIPGFHLIPDVTAGEQEHAIAHREDFWPREPINSATELHAEFPFDSIPKASGN